MDEHEVILLESGFRVSNALAAENGSAFDHATVVMWRAEQAAWKTDHRHND